MVPRVQVRPRGGLILRSGRATGLLKLGILGSLGSTWVFRRPKYPPVISAVDVRAAEAVTVADVLADTFEWQQFLGVHQTSRSSEGGSRARRKPFSP